MKIRLQGLKDQPHYKVKKCWVVKKTFLVCEYHAKGNHDRGKYIRNGCNSKLR
jgi:hypothetical protein